MRNHSPRRRVGAALSTLTLLALAACTAPAPTPTVTTPELDSPTVRITYTADGSTSTVEGHPDRGLCTSDGHIAMRATDVTKDAGVSFSPSDTNSRPVNGFARGDTHDVMFTGKGAVTESEVDGKRVFSANDVSGWVNVGDAGTGPVDLIDKQYETFEDATMSFVITCP